MKRAFFVLLLSCVGSAQAVSNCKKTFYYQVENVIKESIPDTLVERTACRSIRGGHVVVVNPTINFVRDYNSHSYLPADVFLQCRGWVVKSREFVAFGESSERYAKYRDQEKSVLGIGTSEFFKRVSLKTESDQLGEYFDDEFDSAEQCDGNYNNVPTSTVGAYPDRHPSYPDTPATASRSCSPPDLTLHTSVNRYCCDVYVHPDKWGNKSYCYWTE